MRNNLENYFKSYWVAGIAIAAAVSINVVAWVGVKEARSEYIQKNKELAALTVRRSSPVQINRESEKIATVKDRVTRSFVSPGKIVDFIVFLEDLAKETGNSVSISSADEDPASASRAEAGGDKADKNLFKFKVALTGSYSSFVNFLARLENSPYLTRLRKIEIFQTIEPLSKQPVLKENLDIEVSSI